MAFVYNWLIFPFVAGFLLVLAISAFLSSNRLTLTDRTESLSVLGSLAMLLVFTLIGSILGLETFAVDPYGGSKS